MIVCITEKPSVARDIASLLGANTKRDGYFEGGDYAVTWTFGHLCELKEPHDYTDLWKRWSLGALPMIPDRFGIKLKDDKGIAHQFEVIKSLIDRAGEVINCGDAGQEGELIQRWVMQKAGIKCPVRRLWISSLTDQAIKDGFSNLRPEADFDRLYYAGLSRAIGDWILGMNATRLYTLKYSQPGNVLSIGRVQTPTLALIVKRQLEIENFSPSDFWELKTVYRGVTFNVTSGRFDTEEKAQVALAQIKDALLTVLSVTEKKGKEKPPKLFDLTSLQVECNKQWGWSADTTLTLIQSLYEKKVTTYPRVDTTYLSEDLHAKIPGIMQQMTPYAQWTAPVLAGPITKSKNIFDNTKVTDHHAIIPTGQSPNLLVGDERKLYHLIALRFIAAFYPECTFNTTTVMADVNGVEFKATGKVILAPGWRTVYGSQMERADAAGDKILPPMTPREQGPHEPAIQKGQTQPPKYYTEGTLLRAMESAGKTVDDDELREAMKENGIGRPSTRAAIIETLFRRRYIVRERKNIMATKAGVSLIATINEELLKSAKLTGLWENKLRRIERGDYSASEFITELKDMISVIVNNVLTDNSKSKIEISADTDVQPEAIDVKPTKTRKPRAKAPQSLEEIKCPVCGEGHLLKGSTAYGCSRYKDGCGLRLSFEEYASTLTPAQLARKLKTKK